MGDFEMEKWRPRGTAKSRSALEERVMAEAEALNEEALAAMEAETA